MKNLFVYGSLLFPEIVNELTGSNFQSKPAILKDYTRVLVHGADYPAIIKEKKTEVEGMILFNVDSAALNIISFYEGGDYDKVLVTVNENGYKIPALTFVWRSEIDYLSDESWSMEHFKKESLDYYLKEIVPLTLKTYYETN